MNLRWPASLTVTTSHPTERYHARVSFTNCSAQSMMTAAPTASPTVLLSDGYAGTHVLLDGCTMRGSRGYSMVRASHSLSHGSWYVEVSWLLSEDDTAPHPHGSRGNARQSTDCYAPAVRVGWCTADAPIDAPVGFDAGSFGYASRTGQAFHQSQGKLYGQPFGQSAIALLPHLTLLSTTFTAQPEMLHSSLARSPCLYVPPCVAVSGDVVGMLLHMDERGESRNVMHFSLNGCWLGAAFSGFPQTRYYPAVSAYQHAQVHCRFQPPYLFPPQWQEQLSAGMRVNWRVEIDAAIAHAIYRYWRQNKKAAKAERVRGGKRARRKRTLFAPE